MFHVNLVTTIFKNYNIFANGQLARKIFALNLKSILSLKNKQNVGISRKLR